MRDSPALRRIVLGAVLTVVAMAGATVASAGDRPRERFVPVQARVVVPAGGRATVGIRVQRPAGAFVRHRFRFARVPAGLRVRWKRETANGDLTLVITAARNLSPGTRRVRLAYVGGATAVIRVVTPARRGTFTLAVEPSVVEVPVGEEREVQLAVRRVAGFGSSIDLSAEGSRGVAAEVDPETLDGTTTTAVLRVSGDEAGTGQVTVTAQGGGQRRSATVTVRVVEPPVPAPLVLTLTRNEARIVPVSLQAGQAVTVRAIVESGDVDLSAFDGSGVRLALSAGNGTATEEVSLTGPGDFRVEARAVVNSTVRIETVEP